ncbi:TetR/AcrR family transcriptional regulator [Lentzea sp. NBRC 105346]|uniref:TetR/AcrR family transcriptional regulator n=1 Tax=Lentzea sp. NBRC 105346 TaxID=3032205 RepID=UPI0025539DE5|nr:TetR/AcrR family transcriptional regulator [Lentzea sp. NBRC 105346]
MSAELTRTLVRDTAHRLFVANGYGATSVRDVAVAAGVSEEAVHTDFPTKAALYREALNAALAVRPERVTDRAAASAVFTPLRATDIIETTAAGAASLLSRAGALIMRGIECAGTDPEMRRIATEGEAAQRATMKTLASALIATGSVRPDFTADEVADILVGLCSPHLHHLLGWPEHRYRYWLASTMKASLLR